MKKAAICHLTFIVYQRNPLKVIKIRGISVFFFLRIFREVFHYDRRVKTNIPKRECRDAAGRAKAGR